MTQTEMASPPAVVESKERKIIFLLCCIAAIHVFIFSAAFPFFNNVDEQPNFDLAVKYSHAHVPRSLEPFSTDAVHDIAFYQSYAFMGNPTNFPGNQLPAPPWNNPAEEIRRTSLAESAVWQTAKNYECSQPPLYYALAGLWRHVGKWIGFEGERLLYWLRFLNVLFAVALVWLGYATARLIFPENFFLKLGVSAMVAFLPQTAFYSINNDMLSSLCFGVAFFWLLKLLNTGVPDARIGIALGLALAATFLAKMSNLPLLAVAVAVVFLKIRWLEKTKQWRAALPGLTALLLCAGLPAGIWMAWCKIHFGDFTGSEIKIGQLGWTHKPFIEWWQHPIFTPGGVWTFLSGLLATFWRGEFFWHGRPMTSPAIDIVYVIVTILTLALAGKNLLSRHSLLLPPQREALQLALVCFVVAVLFWAWLSTAFDFGNFIYPSRQRPYFTSGRLLLGALIPFLLLFIHGLDHALKKSGNRAKVLVLGAMIFFMLASEIIMDRPVFANEYNWFHL